MADSDPTGVLERAVARARALEVRSEHRDAAVAATMDAALPAEARWRWFVGLSWATTAAAVFALVLWRPSQPLPPLAVAPVAAPPPATARFEQLGARVALHARDGARYAVVRADEGLTRVVVVAGAVGFRLFHGEGAHRLVVDALGLSAEAVGTVFTVGLEDAGPFVTVHEGKVAARLGAELTWVDAGRTWHTGGLSEDATPEPWLTGLTESDLVALAPRADPIVVTEPPARPQRERPVAAPAPAADPEPQATPEPSPVEQWRVARLLRGQGKYTEAEAALTRLAARDDATWSPFALLELARLLASPLHDPGRALQHVVQFRARYPAHPLAPEASALRCELERQLHGTAPPECREVP